jgi:SAM-dependent methyltransferase
MLLIQRINDRSAICPYCGGRSAFDFLAGDWNQHSTEEAFSYYRCDACSLIFVSPALNDLRKYYVHEQYDIPGATEKFDERANTQIWKLDILQRYVSAGTLLELGPATGEFATVARQRGFQPTLIEMDSSCCEFLRRLKHDVIESSDPEAALDRLGEFDAICAWQVIEHIPRFWSFVEKAACHLKTGGALVISTPNPDSFQARWMGRTWPHADAPRHVYLISPRWFARLAACWRLRIVLCTTTDVGSIGLNYYGWYLWVRNWFVGFSKPSIDRWAAQLTRAFARWEIAEGKGCSYVLVMIKQ